MCHGRKPDTATAVSAMIDGCDVARHTDVGPDVGGTGRSRTGAAESTSTVAALGFRPCDLGLSADQSRRPLQAAPPLFWHQAAERSCMLS